VLSFILILSIAWCTPDAVFGQPGPNTQNGPWNNDIAIYKYNPTAATNQTQRLWTFPRAGVSTLTRLKDGRLITAFQNFPENDTARFDKVAVSFSSDEGVSWTDPATINVTGMDSNLLRPFDPTLVVLYNGRIRLYYTSRISMDPTSDPMIFSALSKDGINYRFEPGVRFAVPGKFVIDCAVTLLNRTYHLFSPDNGANTGNFMNMTTTNNAYHAISTNGINFTRVDDVSFPNTNNKFLGNVVNNNGTLNFFGTGPGPWPAVSNNIEGSSWSNPSLSVSAKQAIFPGFPPGPLPNPGPKPPGPQPGMLPGADPGAVKLKDGTWLISVTAPQVKPPPPGMPQNN
jgi:hypothetical protein